MTRISTDCTAKAKDESTSFRAAFVSIASTAPARAASRAKTIHIPAHLRTMAQLQQDFFLANHDLRGLERFAFGRSDRRLACRCGCHDRRAACRYGHRQTALTAVRTARSEVRRALS